MTPSREEIAVRVLCALVTKDGVNGYGSASDAVRAADDLLLALKPAEVAPVPPPAPTPAPEVLTPDVPEGSTIAQLAAEQRASMGLTASVGGTQYFKHDTTPAPEAKRPTHVRVTREIPSWSGGDRIEAGTVFPVERWEGANGGYPFVKPTGRNGFILHPREWEPCAAPPAPESKRDEAVRCAERAVVEAAEAVYANGYGFAKDRLLDAVEALRRAREAGLCEGGSK